MRKFLILLLALASFAPAALLAQDEGDAPGGQPLTLRPGDVVKVVIWREEDLSGDFQVDEEGVIVLPLLGERRVTEVPLRDLRRQLEAEYREHLRNPSISITPLRRVNVLGEVKQPGLYNLDPTVSLAGAISTAGGHSQEGTLSKVTVVRDGRVVRTQPAMGATLQDLGVRSGDEIYVGRRGWFDRNGPTVLAAGLSLVTGILTTLIIVSSNNSGGN